MSRDYLVFAQALEARLRFEAETEDQHAVAVPLRAVADAVATVIEMEKEMREQNMQFCPECFGRPGAYHCKTCGGKVRVPQ